MDAWADRIHIFERQRDTHDGEPATAPVDDGRTARNVNVAVRVLEQIRRPACRELQAAGRRLFRVQRALRVVQAMASRTNGLAAFGVA